MQLTQRALIASNKTVRPSPPTLTPYSMLTPFDRQSIRTAEDGLISFQFMIPLASPSRRDNEKRSVTDLSGFVEFLCVPLEEEVG